MDLSTPKVNLDSKESAFAYLLQNPLTPGQRMHVGIVGNHVIDDATFVSMLWPDDTSTAYGPHDGDTFIRSCLGFVLSLNDQRIELLWGDIIELWPLPSQG